MAEEEEMVTCPYNVAHTIIKRRLPAHLIKCRQQYPLAKFDTCPFNASHIVPEAELTYHIETCSDRKQIDNMIYTFNESESEDEIPTNIETPAVEENWDEEECSGTSYLDVKDQALEKQLVFRVPVGKSKAERKKFFKKEAIKFASVDEKASGIN